MHLSDISWNETGEDAIRNFKKGDEVETVILAIDPERERISLGIKQLEQDPFQNFMGAREKGDLVNGTVKEVDAKGAVIVLADGVEGYLRASEISRERVEDARMHFNVGDEVEAKFMGIDKKSKVVNLSIKAKDQEDEAAAMKGYTQAASSAMPTLGDIFKEQMENK